MTIKEQVFNLHGEGYSVRQISELTGFTPKQIHSVYSKTTKVGVNRHDLIKPREDLKQLIIGSLLGDGSFTKPYKDGSRLSIAHTVDQKELITYKHNILKRYNLEGSLVYNKINNKRYKEGYIEEYRFKSKTHPIFKHVRDRYYRKGHKGVFKRYLKRLTPLGIAIWYMDDGNVTEYSFQFNTQSFYKDEKELLQEALDEFNIQTTLHKQGQIYILAESRDTFVEMVKPHILDSMQYKLVPYRHKESC